MTAVAHIAESKHDTSYWVSVCLVGVTQINSTLTGDSLYNLMTGNNNFNIRFVQVKIYPNIHPFMCSPLRSHLPFSISGICRISEKNMGSLCSQTGWESKPVLKYLIKKKKKSQNCFLLTQSPALTSLLCSHPPSHGGSSCLP